MPTLSIHLWYDKEAVEAAEFYVSVFGKDARIANKTQIHGTPSGDVDIVDMEILGHGLTLISAGPLFRFNEAISLVISCDTQEEIDYYWGKLSAVPEAEQCGWLKDKYGVSWQVVPTDMARMMKEGTKEQIDRVTQAFLPMKKFDVAALRRAYEGK